MDLITKDSETTLVLFSSLDRVLEHVEYVVMNYRPLLGYVQLPGKIIYRESEILDLLERHYRK